jgi:transposase InsO family protein
MGDNMRTDLVIESLKQAAGRFDLDRAISHSDRGSQYTSENFHQIISKFNIRQSMNSAAGRWHDPIFNKIITFVTILLRFYWIVNYFRI